MKLLFYYFYCAAKLIGGTRAPENKLYEGVAHYFGLFLGPIMLIVFFVVKDTIYSNYRINIPDALCLVLIIFLPIYIYWGFNMSDTCKKYISRNENNITKMDGIIGIMITSLPVIIMITYMALTKGLK